MGTGLAGYDQLRTLLHPCLSTQDLLEADWQQQNAAVIIERHAWRCRRAVFAHFEDAEHSVAVLQAMDRVPVLSTVLTLGFTGVLCALLL